VAAPMSSAVLGAALGLLGIFVPGLLILLGALPFWNSLRRQAAAQSMMSGINASVVGLLAAALYSPIWTSSVKTPRDFGVALLGFALLTAWHAPPLVVVIIAAASGALFAVI
jgi:chromate transporter